MGSCCPKRFEYPGKDFDETIIDILQKTHFFNCKHFNLAKPNFNHMKAHEFFIKSFINFL